MNTVFETIKAKGVSGKIPILGICIGMHLPFDSSAEGEKKVWLNKWCKTAFSDAFTRGLPVPNTGC